MKNRITNKLIAYFLIIVVVNSLITSGIFIFLSYKSYIASYKADLARRADNIAQGISENMDIFATIEEGGPGQGRKASGRSNPKEMRISSKYINWMNEVLDGKVWLIYKTDRVFQRGSLDMTISYDDLSKQEKVSIDEAFEGKTITTESFDNFFEEGTLSVVAPLQISDGTIYGAILIHQNIAIAQSLLKPALYILVLSVTVSMLFALILVVFFARRFIRPINRIDVVAKDMIKGDYQVTTNIHQKDEIGDLAKNMDELALRLETVRLESEKLDQMRNDFISNISHELRTPVTVMKSSLEGLVSGLIKENEIPDYHQLLYKEIGILERLVTDLMELNAVKNENFPMNFQEEDLILILNDAVRSQRVLAKEKGIDLIVDAEDSYLMFHCDYTRLRQMFTTVINNGIKYSYPSEKVIVKEFKAENQVIVQIINKGKPISVQDKENIFQSFYRVKDTSEKGFGLGLAIAKEIAKRHKIAINVLSGDAGETVFEFLINGGTVAT